MDLIDTDVLIDVQRGHPPALAWFGGLTALPGVPGLVVMELIQDARNKKEVRAALKLTARCKSSGRPTSIVRALSDFTTFHLHTAWVCSTH